MMVINNVPRVLRIFPCSFVFLTFKRAGTRDLVPSYCCM